MYFELVIEIVTDNIFVIKILKRNVKEDKNSVLDHK